MAPYSVWGLGPGFCWASQVHGAGIMGQELPNEQMKKSGSVLFELQREKLGHGGAETCREWMKDCG